MNEIIFVKKRYFLKTHYFDYMYYLIFIYLITIIIPQEIISNGKIKLPFFRNAFIDNGK